MNLKLELERIQLIKESQDYFKGVRYYHSLNYLEEICSSKVPELRYRRAEFKRVNENEYRTLDFIENFEEEQFPESVKKNFSRSLDVMSGFRDF